MVPAFIIQRSQVHTLNVRAKERRDIMHARRIVQERARVSMDQRTASRVDMVERRERRVLRVGEHREEVRVTVRLLLWWLTVRLLSGLVLSRAQRELRERVRDGLDDRLRHFFKD